MRIEKIFTYVKNQNTTLHATPRAAMPPNAVLTTPVPLFTLFQPCQCNIVKIIKTPDFFTFYAEPQRDKILYKNWHLQMLNKISANKLTMPIEALKLVYIQSFTANNAFVQLKLRLCSATKPFKMASKIFKVLTAVFGNANQKQETWAQYCDLRQKDKNFSTFWAKF